MAVPVRENPPAKPRRVYTSAGVGAGRDGTHTVLLDGKPAVTPLRSPLSTKAYPLAEAVAAEWEAQTTHVDPLTMPLTRLLATEIDRTRPQREAVIASLLTHIDADSICYRAPHPADLRARQARSWQPVLDWISRDTGIVLAASEGSMPAAQAPETTAGLRSVLEGLNDVQLNAFQAAAALCGSLALALALVRGRLSADDTFAAAFLDELYQAEKWGEDKEALDRRRRIAADLAAIARYLALAS